MHASKRPPRRAPQNALALLLAAVTGLVLLAGCGRDRAPGGAGRLEPADEGGAALLVLEGTPYEMGWWYGHLLKDTILARVARARRVEPRDFIEAMADAALLRVTERTRQELDGMAAATGLEPLELLIAEVEGEALRYRGAEAELLGVAGLAPRPDGFRLRMALDGPGADAFAQRALLIHRKPTGRAESVALARPGSLGAWAYLTADGDAYVVAEVEITNRQRKGFGGGRPFELMAREALDATGDVERYTAELTGSMGHVGIGVSYRPSQRPAVRAMAGVQVYGAPDLPWTLGERPFLAIGPYDDPESPDAKALQAQVVEAQDLEEGERWLRLQALQDGARRGSGPQPEVLVEAVGEQLSLSFVVGSAVRRVAFPRRR